MGKEIFLNFEFEDALDPKSRELVALAAASAAGCRH